MYTFDREFPETLDTQIHELTAMLHHALQAQVRVVLGTTDPHVSTDQYAEDVTAVVQLTLNILRKVRWMVQEVRNEKNAEIRRLKAELHSFRQDEEVRKAAAEARESGEVVDLHERYRQYLRDQEQPDEDIDEDIDD